MYKSNKFGFALLICLIATPIQCPAQSPIEAVLEIPEIETTTFYAGERVLFDVTLRNISDQPVTILPPLDGSMIRIRYPRYETIVQPPILLPGYYPETICGNSNPLSEEDFILLQPGESAETMHFAFLPWMAGEYRIAYSIKFDAEFDEYRGDYYEETPPDSFMEKFEMLPKVDLLTNTAAVNIVSNGNTLDPKYHCLMGMPKGELLKIFYSYSYNTSNPWIMGLPTAEIWTSVHFNHDEIVDGVELKLRNNSSFLLSEDHLKWLRGGVESIIQQIEYRDDTIYALRVGYFADPSGVGEAIFEGYR